MLKNKINYILENTKSADVKNICENFLNYITVGDGIRLPEIDVESTFVQTLKECNSKDIFTINFLANYNVKFEKINNLGIKECIKELKESIVFGSNKYPMMNIIVNKYDGALKNVKEYQIIEHFLREMDTYSTINVVDKNLNILKENYRNNFETIFIINTINELKMQKNTTMFDNCIKKIELYLNEEKSITSDIIEKDLGGYMFNHSIKNLYNYFKNKELNENKKNSFEINSIDRQDFEVNDLYTIVIKEKAGDIINIEGTYYILDESGMKRIPNYKPIKEFNNVVNILNKIKIRFNENKIYFYHPNTKRRIDIVLKEDIREIHIDNKKVAYANVISPENLIHEGTNKFFENKEIGDVLTVFYNIDNIIKFPFVKKIESNIYEGVSYYVINYNNKLSMIKYNKYMNENNFYSNIHAVQIVNEIKNVFKYDISESIKSFFQKDTETISVLSRQQNKIIDEIKSLEESCNKIKVLNKEQNDKEFLLESNNLLNDITNKIKKMQNELYKIQEKINEYYDAERDEDVYFGVGDIVSIKNTNVSGKVISIDTTNNTGVVMLDNGDSREVSFNDITKQNIDIEPVDSDIENDEEYENDDIEKVETETEEDEIELLNKEEE